MENKNSEQEPRQALRKTDVMPSYKGLPKPKLEDFYDTSDPRGCSSSEYEDYANAVKKWELENNYA
jgi:hypothetical protein